MDTLPAPSPPARTVPGAPAEQGPALGSSRGLRQEAENTDPRSLTVSPHKAGVAGVRGASAMPSFPPSWLWMEGASPFIIQRAWGSRVQIRESI